MPRAEPHTLIIGAGIGGLTVAALLLRAGRRVTVLESHVYPGGSAGTFFYKGYRFDAGATLAGGFSPGGPHARLGELLGLEWPVRPADPAWVTHLPGLSVTQWADPAAWQAERERAFPGSGGFWALQERLADLAWDLSTRSFPWPPGSPRDLLRLAAALRPRTLAAAPYLFSNLGSLIPRSAPPELTTFLDAQLIISAQTVSAQANALYAAAALDLPRRGVNHVRGGIGALAHTLVEWIRANGGQVHYRQAVEKIEPRGGQAWRVKTRKGVEWEGDQIVANLQPRALADLLGPAAPPALRRESGRARGWGAFMLYLGVDRRLIPPGLPDHHQVVVNPALPPGEGNTVFLSLSDPDDETRAPAGLRTLTLSTHTAVEDWWRAFRADPQAYAARKEAYTQRCLDAAERALPGLRSALRLCLPATPLTFQFYTRRPLGMVGGSPQTSLLRARGPRTGLPNLWLVGDAIFPGQSTAGVTLGGMRVAAEILSH